MNETRLNKGRRNIQYGFLQYLVNILLTWLGRVIFVHILSAEYLGISGLFSNIINILAIADLGIPSAMAYAMYKPLADGDTHKISAIVSFFRRIYLVIAGLVFLIGIAMIPLLPRIVNLETPIPHMSYFYVMALLNTVISYLFVYRTILFTADQKNYVIQKYLILFRFAAFAAQAALLILFRDYFLYLAAGVIVTFVSNVCQNRAAIREYPYLKNNSAVLPPDERKRIWQNVKDMFIYRICGTVQTNTDSMLISFFSGTLFVGYYSNYQMMTVAVTSVLNIVFTNVKAGLGNLIANDDSTPGEKLNVFWTMELINYWITAFCSVSFICLFRNFIELSFGIEYVLPIWTVVAIVLNFYTSNIRQPLWAFRETTGIFHETRYVTAVTAILNIVFSIVLGYYFGMLGVLAATVIARMVYAWWREPVILFRNCFMCSPKPYFYKYMARFVLFAAVCYCNYRLCEIIDTGNPYVSFAIKVLVCLVFPNGVFALYYHRVAGLRSLWHIIRDKGEKTV